MRILALDSGAERCGLAILDEGKLLFSSILCCPRGEEKYQVYRTRLMKQFSEWGAYYEEKWRPDVVVCEIIPVITKNNSTQLQLAATAATAFMAAAYSSSEFECNLDQIAAVTVKKKLTGNSRATKVAVRNAVFDIYPDLKDKVDKRYRDDTDAIAISIIYERLNSNA